MSVQTATIFDREQAILSHMPQVRLLAFRAHQRCPSEVELDDLVSAGTLGLIQAMDRFEPGRGLKLNTFAEHRIRGAILDYLRALDPMPRAARFFQRQREEAKSRLESRLDRPPSETETVAELGCSLKRYRELSLVVRAASIVSLDSPVDKSAQRLRISESRVSQIKSLAIVRLRIPFGLSGGSV